MSDNVQPVLPIDADEGQHRTPPPLLLVAALLGIGGLVGWGAATLGADRIATVTPPGGSSLGDDAGSADTPAVSWAQATAVPEVPSSASYEGMTNAVEANGTIYVVARFTDSESPSVDNYLWSSDDGAEWTASLVDVGQEVAITELTAIGNDLLLTGSSEAFFGLWRSVPGRAIDGTSWSRVALDLPDNFSPIFHATATNRRGEIVTTAIGSLEIWRELIAPYLPTGVDGLDPEVQLEDRFLVVPGGTGDPVFSETPEVVATAGDLWIRLVTLEGEEVLQTRPLPPGTFPISHDPALTYIPVALSWVSEDAIDFSPITATGALPTGYSLPAAWQDGFVSATYELSHAFAPNEIVTMWATASGRFWDVAEIQPPSVCSPFFLAVSRNRLLLTSDDPTLCIGTADDEWTVLETPAAVSFAVGGGAGFLGYEGRAASGAASFSEDGVSWVDIVVPEAESYPMLRILERRLLAISVDCCDTATPGEIDLWIGEIE